jgi:hypothetical protein
LTDGRGVHPTKPIPKLNDDKSLGCPNAPLEFLVMKLQFSLRQLLMAMAFVCIVTAAVLHHFRKKERAITRLEQLGASISYDYQWSKTKGWLENARPPGDSWWKQILGEHYASEPVEVMLFSGISSMKPKEFTDRDAELLAMFPKIKWLVLYDTSVTDASLKHFAAIPALERLDLEFTRVTEAGAKEFRATRPNTQIFIDEI